MALSSVDGPSAEPDSSLDTSPFSDVAKRGLVDALYSIPGAKTLILERDLAAPVGLITEISMLKHQAVEKIHWLEPGPLIVDPAVRNVVWMCRPRIRWMKLIAAQIKAHLLATSAAQHAYSLILVPRATALCRRILEDEGVLGDVQLVEYLLRWIPLEKDVLSLELRDAAREIFCDSDESSVYYAAQAMHQLQRTMGTVPRLVGKGDVSQRLVNQMSVLRETDPDPSDALRELSPSIDAAIFLDRSTDWVTPMLTMLTYEGLIDETFGIQSSNADLPASIANPAPAPGTTSTPTAVAENNGQKKKHLLDSSDTLFADLRDRNFQVVRHRLSDTARRLQSEITEGKQGKDIKQMKSFVSKLPGLQKQQAALGLHIRLSEEIAAVTHTDDFNKSLEIQQNILSGYDLAIQLMSIEELITRDLPINQTLRLLVLHSLVSGGVKTKSFDPIRREFLQVYGYDKLPFLLTLDKVGLLVRQSTVSSASKPVFPTLRKQLRLVVEDAEDAESEDISSVYSGYAPLSVRLVQCVAQKSAVLSAPAAAGPSSSAAERVRLEANPIVGWKGFEDVLAGLPGKTFDIAQTIDLEDMSRSGRIPKAATATTIVFFVGGCTFTEIAAIRKIAEGMRGRRFLICTTSIVSGNSLLNSFAGPPPKPLGK